MLYFPRFIFVAGTIWIAGGRKALEITAAWFFLCLIFGVGFNALLTPSILRLDPLWPEVLLFTADPRQQVF